jgi:hypothetical protein
MKAYTRLLLIVCALAALVTISLLLAAPTAVGQSASAALPPEPDSQPPDVLSINKVEAPPVIFPPDPGWPEYAQREITVDPEPPILGQPTEICAWVVNTTGVTQTVTLDFGVANFGIGLPFQPIGTRTIEVPPFSKVKACVVWIPRQPGHWCIQVILHQFQQPDLRSQRNIDIWETFTLNTPAVTVFPVRNNTGQTTDIQMSLVNLKPGWQAYLDPPTLPGMKAEDVRPVTLTVIPQTLPLGTHDPIVDVEAHDASGLLIGGFRKMDWPPVPLHRPPDPTYAESEIDVSPYPPLPGEPTEICVELRNLSNEPQTVEVGFDVASFGIGLPFTPIDQRTVTIPPNGKIKVCTTWIPPQAGHFCVQVRLSYPQGRYQPQWSQRNLDVSEILKPGVPDVQIIQVRNPQPITTTVYLTATWVDSFFDVFFDPPELPDMGPSEIRPVQLTVIPGQGDMPEDGTPVADVEGYVLEGQDRIVIGGIRKIFRPPIPIHQPHEPPYGESEITISPYPPEAKEPVVICTELRNPTPVTQTVNVEFGIANFGIGMPFTPIDHQTVELPPFSRTRVCTTWVPSIGGHFCAQIIIRQPGYRDVFSQRNMDVAEYLRPNTPDSFEFPVSNPFDEPITVALGLVEHLPGWDVRLSDDTLPNLLPHTHETVTMIVTPTGNLADLEDEAPVVDVEAYVDGRLLGGFRKLFRPPIPIHHPDDPPYAEREISIEPYPPRAGEPTEICVELRNPTDFTQTIWVEFAWANFGIGLPFHPFHGQMVTLPPHSIIKKCTVWVPPFNGHFCVQVSLIDPGQRYRVMRSQRNIDVGEIFIPGKPTEPFVFRVGNSLPFTATIEMAAFVHLEGWRATLDPPVLPEMAPNYNETRPVTLTVFVPPGPLPQDDTPVVDVEAHAAGQLIGGFRKLYRPPVPIHQPQDPIYAESEIHITPYPPREREPTEICVDVRNPTNMTQTFTVTFAVANFGIGLPFHDIARPIAVTLLPNSIKRVCITWVPPFGGHFCAQVTIQVGNHDPVHSQRNMDVGEVFIPGQPSVFPFPVRNPTTGTVTVTLGMVPHVENWALELSQDVLPNMKPDETRPVTLTVIPPVGQPFPQPDEPVVDVEAYIGRELIGGFRKLFNPPVPVHVPKDPPYAESEIFVDPYPTRVGIPTLLGAIVYNPTPFTQRVTVTFGVANFGIGWPFTQTGIVMPTVVVNVPPMGMARAQTLWMPWLQGHFCVQIKLESAGHEPVYSQRNMDVGEPLKLGESHSRPIQIYNPMTQVVTITLALINHRPEWQMTLTPTVFANVMPGAVNTATLTVQPPDPTNPQEREEQLKSLADERPIADVEAYINGELMPNGGGIRKIAKPPIPLHKPQDRPYAESEISVTPYPLQAGQPATITTQIMNTSEETQTVQVEFRVANFGMGIPFTNTNITPTYRVITLGPGISVTVGTEWRPPFAGHWCIQITLLDPLGQYPPQYSQRNVDVERRPANSCEPIVRDFWLQNSTGLTVTVTLGSSAVNLPPGWIYSTSITETVLGPYQGVTVTLTITPPCGLAALDWLAPEGALGAGASSLAEVNVEGYINGEPVPESGGIQVQIEIGPPENKIYLPIVMKN